MVSPIIVGPTAVPLEEEEEEEMEEGEEGQCRDCRGCIALGKEQRPQRGRTVRPRAARAFVSRARTVFE